MPEIHEKPPCSLPVKLLRAAIVVALLIMIAGTVARTVWRTIAYNFDYERPTGSRFDAQPPAAALRDDAPIVGVTVAGHCRAYLVQALVRPDNHVYNDMLGNVPVTVTFCDVGNCVAVYTAEGRDAPLDIRIAGAHPSRPKKMLLQIGPDQFWQDTDLPFGNTSADKVPYARMKFERTTWGTWRAAHPDTDIYVGNQEILLDEGASKIAPPTGKR